VSEVSDLDAVNAVNYGGAATVGRNLSTRYLAIMAEMGVGLLVLPFNLSHLGKAAYGLWVLTTSITAYFSVLDLGYSGAVVKFVAEYRAKKDSRALNEILSTTFYLFTSFGVLTYVIAIVLAIFIDRVLHLTPDQVHVARMILLITSVNVALGTACTVFGAVINGFQRYDLNNVAGTISTVAVAVVNVLVLWAGYGLVQLVFATTLVRVLTYWVYRANAYRVFPAMRLRLDAFRRDRLRELTSFSVFMAIIDWANKLNYSIDAIVIGIMLGTGAVAVWSVGQRLAEATQRLTNQLNEVIFPTIVDHSASSRIDELRRILLAGTRLSLATVVPIAGVLMLMGRPLIHAWVGPDFEGSVIVVQLLAVIVVVRVGNATASTLLKGADRHRLVAAVNIITAIVNVAFSIVLARSFGLAGVAIGTLIPISAAAIFVIFPAGCRRVEMPMGRAFAHAIWPALWPAGMMAAYVAISRPMIPSSLPAVLINMCVAVCVYVATFLAFGIGATERRFYLSKIFEATTRARVLLPRPSESA
jgi:O-antigen/teichoic acid export membrane protein